jgi:hypothetical protein
MRQASTTERECWNDGRRLSFGYMVFLPSYLYRAIRGEAVKWAMIFEICLTVT